MSPYPCTSRSIQDLEYTRKRQPAIRSDEHLQLNLPLNAGNLGENGLQFLFAGNGCTVYYHMTSAIYGDKMPVRISR